MNKDKVEQFYRQWAEGCGVLYQFVKKLVQEAKDFGYDVTLVDDSIIIKKNKENVS